MRVTTGWIAYALAIAGVASPAAWAEEARLAAAPPEVRPAPQVEQPPDPSRIPWDSSLFAYQRPERMVVEESTASAEQVAIFGRPSQAAGDAPPRRPPAPPSRERSAA